MKIINSELVRSIDRSNDQMLSQLCTDDYSIIVNPELDISVMDLITVDVPLSDYCIKYKIGEGWIAKRFSKQWNGLTQIIQLPINPFSISVSKYAILNSKILDYKVPAWDLPYKHVWVYDKSLCRGEEADAITISYIASASGRKIIGVADAKPADINDVIFITYNELGAEDNWRRLKEVCPRAKKVSGVKGIYNAHVAASNISDTDMFYVVDADAYVTNFKFDYIPAIQDLDTVHVWYSRNPVNGLEYGYGGVKLFAKTHFQNTNDNVIDVATGVGSIRIIPEVVCETRFNTDPFNTWKSAFRECVKLSSKIIPNQISTETEERLRIWTTVGCKYSVAGARAGVIYSNDNTTTLNKINDYNWLRNKFIQESI